MKLSKSIWASYKGSEVFLFTMSNGNTEVSFTNYGCTVTALRVYSGKEWHNIVLGYNSFSEYLNDPYYMGCIVGRFANRIGNASFELEGSRYQLSMNETALNNHNHGGVEGLGKKLFSVAGAEQSDDRLSVRMEYRSEHLEEGYPGTVDISVTYELNDKGEFAMYFGGTTDRTTHLNLTSHLYFNLAGAGDISNHSLSIDSSNYLESDERFLPTGKILPVENSRYDFRTLRKIMVNHRGKVPVYNTYFLFDHNSSAIQAVLSGSNVLSLGIRTSLPGVLLYTGDYLQHPFTKHGGVCLECQFPPDAPNHSHFPSTALRPGEVYDHFVKYLFSA